MFHSLARTAADVLMGKKSNEAWCQVNRALEHGKVRSACSNREVMEVFPDVLREFAATFVDLQKMRHDADYSYEASYAKEDALAIIDRAERAIDQLKGASIVDQPTFVVHMPFKRRSR